MYITRSRTLTLVVGSVLLLGPLSACGADDKPKAAAGTAGVSTSSTPTPTPTPRPTPTPEATPSAPTPSTDTLSTEGAAKPGERLTKDNLVPTMLAAMRAKKTAHMTMELGSSIGAEADVRYAGSQTDMRMSMEMGPSKVVVVIVDGAIYVQQGAGAKYQKIDRNDGQLGSLLGQMSSLGPEASVSAMRGAVRQVEYVGPATVDGTAVTKYRVTLDPAAISGALGSGMGTMPGNVSYDLYVDRDHLMRRIDMTVAKQHMRMTVSRWGEPVDITAPPASEIQ
jgi:hypothetical protein